MKFLLACVVLFFAFFFTIGCEGKKTISPVITDSCKIGVPTLTDIFYVKSIVTIMDNKVEIEGEPCLADNILKLNANGTYQIQDAGIKCITTADTSGTWRYSQMMITLGNEQFTIASYDCKKLVIFKEWSKAGHNYKETRTMEKSQQAL